MTRTLEPQRRRLVIAGGGTAGWMTAAAIAKTMGQEVDLTLVESDSIGTIGVGEATIPPLATFNRLLDINEAEFMRETKATFKLGINFEGWRDVGEDYFHSFGFTGKDHWTSGFQHFWRRGLDEGYASQYGDYCPEVVAAYEGKFAHLPDQAVNYAYHLDSSLYAQYLRKLAEMNGAVRQEGTIAEVLLEPENGNIKAIRLKDGRIIEGDLFIDCTGFRALLIGNALHIGYDDWTHYLPCDGAIAVQTKSVRDPVPYTRSIAHDAGWQWRIPLQHRVGNGIVYCSRYLSQEEALERLLSSIKGDVITEPNFIRFKTGARRKQWAKNCIAIGLSSGFMEPLESTSIHLIQRSILRLLRLMPSGAIQDADVREFNAQADTDMDQIRDFLILHYNVTERRDSPFWRHCRTMDIPESLAHKIELFRETGRVFRKNDELFAENSWVQVMLGQGILPKRYHPIVNKMSGEELKRFLQVIRDNVRKNVRSLPSHGSYVQHFCEAPQ